MFEEPACDGRRDVSKLDNAVAAWMAVELDGAEAVFPTFELEELIFVWKVSGRL